MKTTTSKSDRSQKNDEPLTRDALYEKLMESVEQLVAKNTEMIENNSSVVESFVRIAAKNDALTSTIQRLSALLHANPGISEKIDPTDLIADYDRPTSGTTEPDNLSRKEWEHHYSVLTEERRQYPLKVLKNFTRLGSLFQQRKDINTLFGGALQSELFEDFDGETSANFFLLYNSLIELSEASYRIVEMINKKELVFNYLDKEGAIIPEGTRY